MQYLSVDYLIVYAFLLITLILGLRAGRGIRDITDYALANRTFGTAALTLSYLATAIGGGYIIYGTEMSSSEGIIYAVAHLGRPIQFSILGLLIAPHMVHFRKCMTLGD